MSNSPTNNNDSWSSRIEIAAQVLGIPQEEVEASLKSDEIGIEKDPLGLEMLNDESVFRFADFSRVMREKNVAMGRIRLAYSKLRQGKNIAKASGLSHEELEVNYP